MLCAADFSIKHTNWLYTLKNTIQRQNKLAYKPQMWKNRCIAKYVTKNEHIRVKNAECLFAEFVLEHHLPISVTGHATKWYLPNVSWQQDR